MKTNKDNEKNNKEESEEEEEEEEEEESINNEVTQKGGKKVDNEKEEEDEEEDEEDEEEEEEEEEADQNKKTETKNITKKEESVEEEDEEEEEEEESKDKELKTEIKKEDSNDIEEDEEEEHEDKTKSEESKNYDISLSEQASSEEKNKIKETTTSESNKNIKQTEQKIKQPTAFSQLSNTLFDKRISAKVRTSILENLNDSHLLSKVVEGNSNKQENKQKIKNFYERNLEFRERKKQKQEKKKEEVENEKIYAEIKSPNNRVFQKNEIRNLEEFYKEQMKHAEQRFYDLKMKNEDKEKDIKKKLKDKPEISENSKKIIKQKEDKGARAEGSNVYDKLYQSKIQNEKKVFYKKEDNKNTSKATVNNTANKENIEKIVDRLYHEGIETVKEKESKAKEEFVNSHYYEKDVSTLLAEAQMNSLLILKFKKDFDLSIEQLKLEESPEEYEQKEDEDENKEDVKIIKKRKTNYDYLNEREFYNICNYLKFAQFYNIDLEAVKFQETNNSIRLNKTVNSNCVTTPNSILNSFNGLSPQDKKNDYLNKKKVEEENSIAKAFNMIRDTQAFTNFDTNSKEIPIDLIFIFFISILGYYQGVEQSDLVKDDDEKWKNTFISKEISLCSLPIDQNKVFLLNENIRKMKINFRQLIDLRTNIYFAKKNKTRKVKLNTANDTIIEENTTSKKNKKKNNYYISKIKQKVSTKMLANLSQEDRKEEEEKINELEDKEIVKEFYSLMKKKKQDKLKTYIEIKKEEEVKECTFQPKIFSSTLPKFSNVNKLFDTDKNLNISIREKWKNKMMDDLKVKEKIKESECTFHPNINKIEKALFSERHIIEDEKVKKVCERNEQARFDRKLKEYQLSRGVLKNKSFNNVEEILKEDEYQPIVFHLEKNVFKDTFDTAMFKKEKDMMLSPTRKKNDEEKRKKEIHAILSLEVNITRTKKEKLEIFAEDDPYLVAEEFSKKYKLNLDKKKKLRLLIETKLNENVKKIY